MARAAFFESSGQMIHHARRLLEKQVHFISAFSFYFLVADKFSSIIIFKMLNLSRGKQCNFPIQQKDIEKIRLSRKENDLNNRESEVTSLKKKKKLQP